MAGPPVAIVTGASSGIGKEIARALRDDGYRVVLACRSAERAAAALEDLLAEDQDPLSSAAGALFGGPGRSQEGSGNAGGLAEFMAVNTADLASVRSFCAAFVDLGLSLRVLVCNAGMNGAMASGKPTVDGFDEVFATNYLGHFLMCHLLAPLLVTAGGRIVMVTSVIHRNALNAHKELTDAGVRGCHPKSLYSMSKLAQILHARELQRRFPSVRVFCVNPGGVSTGIWKGFPWWQRWVLETMLCDPQSVGRAIAAEVAAEACNDVGAAAPYLNLQRLAAALPRNYGEYLGPMAGKRLVKTEPSEAACDDELARRLYLDSERWVGVQPS